MTTDRISIVPDVPEWWPSEFRDRHVRLCKWLVAVLRDAPVPYHLDALIFLGEHRGFSALETELAVYTMGHDGRLVEAWTDKGVSYSAPKEVSHGTPA
jgi:hypothetical protein